MRVLVTGGAGFIGSNYVRHVLRGEYASLQAAHVTVLDKLTYAGNLENLAPVADSERFSFVHGDIADAGLVSEVVAGHDVIVHFAAESHVDRSIEHPSEFVLTNVVGTQVLLDAALRQGVDRFIHVSTDEVYGSVVEGSWTEESPLDPSSPYSASKASSDLIALAYARTHGLHVVVTRCSNNYGPYQYPEKVIPLFVTRLLAGDTVPLYGDGLHVRDWLHVDDHCRGVQLAVDKGRAGEVYHIGGGQELTNRELTERLLNAFGADWTQVVEVPDRKGHDRRYSLSIQKSCDELGYAPTIEFESGLADTVKWYRDHEDWWQPLLRKIPPA